MIISDKQELRRCVKQLVRRADVAEAMLSFDWNHDEVGVEAMLDLWARPAASPGEAIRRACADQTPFSQDAAAMFAALDALDLPVHDLDRAETLQREYERPAYMREILDTLRAKCVLIRVPYSKAGRAVFDDDRCCALVSTEDALFVPGRYGVDYASCAQALSEAMAFCGARNLLAHRFDEQALRYCLFPLCEDQGYALHIHLSSMQEIEAFMLLADQYPGVRVLVSADPVYELSLIEHAQRRQRLLVRLTDLNHICAALDRLGTHFVPYGACAALPEQMLGRWLGAKEIIWQKLCDAYLPLARAGYELQSAAVERDVRRLLSGNLLALCRPDQA